MLAESMKTHHILHVAAHWTLLPLGSRTAPTKDGDSSLNKMQYDQSWWLSNIATALQCWWEEQETRLCWEQGASMCGVGGVAEPARPAHIILITLHCATEELPASMAAAVRHCRTSLAKAMW